MVVKNKNNKFAVVDSPNPIKKTKQCINYCTNNNIDFEESRMKKQNTLNCFYSTLLGWFIMNS